MKKFSENYLMKLISYIFFIFFFIGSLFSQNKTDSLKYELKKTISDTSKVTILKNISVEYLYSNPDSSLFYINEAINIAKIINDKKGLAYSYNQLANVYVTIQNYEKSADNYKKSYDLFNDLDNNYGIALVALNQGILFQTIADFENAENKFLEANEKYTLAKNKAGEAKSILALGGLYENNGEYETAFTYYLEAVKISEEISDKNLLSIANTYVGNISFYLKDFENAINYYTFSLHIFSELGNSMGIIKSYINIADCYNNLQNYDSSLVNILKAKDLVEKNGLIQQENFINTFLGEIYFLKSDYQKSIFYLNETIADSLNTNMLNIADCKFILSKNYRQLKQNEYSKKTLNEAIEIYRELGLSEQLYNCYQEYSYIFYDENNFKEAYKYLELYTILKDSVNSTINQEKISELEEKYESEKKEKEIELLKKEKEIDQNIKIFMTVAGLLLLSLVVAISISYVVKRKDNKLLRFQKKEISEKNEELNQQNEEIKTQRDNLEELNLQLKDKNQQIIEQRDLVLHQKKEITDSIKYAYRIQTAVLPPEELINSLFPESFIVFLPRDIVSGDFYWIRKINDTIIFTAADCTGHGVPGAFMSMLCMSFLNEIMTDFSTDIENLTAAKMLEELRIHVKQALRQTGKEGEAKDGMDISLCIFNPSTRVLNWAGAYNSIVYVVEKQIFEIKADKNPIAIHMNEKPFTNHQITIQNSTSIYLFSDGYEDQFGGEENRKFMAKKLKNLFLEIHEKPVSLQKQILFDSHIKWKGNNEQVDDIVIFGVKI